MGVWREGSDSPSHPQRGFVTVEVKDYGTSCVLVSFRLIPTASWGGASWLMNRGGEGKGFSFGNWSTGMEDT